MSALGGQRTVPSHVPKGMFIRNSPISAKCRDIECVRDALATSRSANSFDPIELRQKSQEILVRRVVRQRSTVPTLTFCDQTYFGASARTPSSGRQIGPTNSTQFPTVKRLGQKKFSEFIEKMRIAAPPVMEQNVFDPATPPAIHILSARAVVANFHHLDLAMLLLSILSRQCHAGSLRPKLPSCLKSSRFKKYKNYNYIFCSLGGLG